MEQDSTDIVGRRIGAGLIDLLIILALGLVLALLIGEKHTGDGSASVTLEGPKALIWVALALLYYGIAEAMTGQTVGKRLLGVQVAAADGSRATTGQVVIRTLLRVIDGIAFYLVGLIAILATGERRQRLGDMAANTTVVASQRR